MLCAAEASAALTRGPSLVVRPVTFTSSTATSGESRSQNWKPAASTRHAASTTNTHRRMGGGSICTVSTRNARARRAPGGAARTRARPRTRPAALPRAPAELPRTPPAAARRPPARRSCGVALAVALGAALAPERRGVDLTEKLDLGLELDPEALADAAAALGHEEDHVGGGGLAHVLDEVGVLLREAGAAHGQPAAAGLVEQHPGAAALGARVVGVLEGRPEGLDAGGL